MDAREVGRRAARRWTGTLAAAGIALAGVVGVGTYHALETRGTTSASSTSDDSATSGTSSTSDDSGIASSSSGLSAGSGTSQTGSSGS